MKKFLLSLVALLTFTALNAAEANFDFTKTTSLNPAVQDSEFSEVKSGSNVQGYQYVVNDKSFTNNGVTVAFAKATAKNDSRIWKSTKNVYDLRCYVNSTITISASENISEIVFAGGTVTVFKASDGTISNGVWSGSAKSVTFTLTGTAKINTIKVTTLKEGEISVVAPKMTPAGGYFYNGVDAPVEVSLSTTTENARIYYKLEKEGETKDFEEYTGAFKVTYTCTLTAYAELNGTKSTESSAAFYIQDIKVVNNIAEFLALEEGTVAAINNEVRVIFSSSNGDLFVTDGGAKNLLVYGRDVYTAHQYKNGDKIAAGIAGTIKKYSGNMQMQYPIVSTFSDPVAGEAFNPTPVTVAEALNTENHNMYAVIKNATISSISGNNATLTVGTETLPLYNRYASANKITYPTDAETLYAVTGILTNYNGKMQMYPLVFTPMSGVEGVDVENVTIEAGVGTIYVNANAGVATVYNAAGQAVVNQVIAQGENSIAVAPGFYIVKVGAKAVKVLVK